MYSYVTGEQFNQVPHGLPHLVNDGIAHRIEIIVQGKRLSLRIDNSPVQSLVNDGEINSFELTTKQNMYIGGLPQAIASKAASAFHVKHTTSMQGERSKR
jgi:hypothetical protein